MNISDINSLHSNSVKTKAIDKQPKGSSSLVSSNPSSVRKSDPSPSDDATHCHCIIEVARAKSERPSKQDFVQDGL